MAEKDDFPLEEVKKEILKNPPKEKLSLKEVFVSPVKFMDYSNIDTITGVGILTSMSTTP